MGPKGSQLGDPNPNLYCSNSQPEGAPNGRGPNQKPCCSPIPLHAGILSPGQEDGVESASGVGMERGRQGRDLHGPEIRVWFEKRDLANSIFQETCTAGGRSPCLSITAALGVGGGQGEGSLPPQSAVSCGGVPCLTGTIGGVPGQILAQPTRCLVLSGHLKVLCTALRWKSWRNHSAICVP